MWTFDHLTLSMIGRMTKSSSRRIENTSVFIKDHIVLNEHPLHTKGTYMLLYLMDHDVEQLSMNNPCLTLTFFKLEDIGCINQVRGGNGIKRTHDISFTMQ